MDALEILFIIIIIFKWCHGSEGVNLTKLEYIMSFFILKVQADPVR